MLNFIIILSSRVQALMFASRCPDEAMLSNGGLWDEDCAVFVFEMLVKVVLQNRYCR